MIVVTVDFQKKKVLKYEVKDVVLEAEREYDFLMNLGEDDEDIERRNPISKTFG